jgi:hypothetical protein
MINPYSLPTFRSILFKIVFALIHFKPFANYLICNFNTEVHYFI